MGPVRPRAPLPADPRARRELELARLVRCRTPGQCHGDSLSPAEIVHSGHVHANAHMHTHTRAHTRLCQSLHCRSPWLPPARPGTVALSALSNVWGRELIANTHGRATPAAAPGAAGAGLASPPPHPHGLWEHHLPGAHGHCGTGHHGTGHHSTGHNGTGHSGTGHHGTGHCSTGHRSTGHNGTGHGGTGHCSTGHRSTGHHGTGRWEHKTQWHRTLEHRT